MSGHPLDRPVWNTLHSGWAHLAEGDGLAIRSNPDFCPFAAMADGSSESVTALTNLIPQQGDVWLVEADKALTLPAGLTPSREAELVQMVADDIIGESKPMDIIDLAEEDAAEMLALATLTKPGPFARHTNRVSQFIGIKDEGRLVAMAGERMKVPGYAEISGVCTLPEYRGRGYAGALMRQVGRRILERGEKVFLHAYASNAGAIGLYESLGFSIRTTIYTSIIPSQS